MAIRRAKKKAAIPKKALKTAKTVKRKLAPRKKAKPAAKVKAIRPKGHWETFRSLQTQVDHAWNAFQSSVKKKAKPEEIARTKNHLLLLLGECNFMAQQCMRLASRSKKR